MSLPSPFELGARIGGNVAGGLQGAQERSTLDQILTEASQSDDPNATDNAINQLLPLVPTARRNQAIKALQERSKQLKGAKPSRKFSVEEREAFRKRGFTKEETDLIEVSPTGGQTEAIKRGLDRIEREKPSQLFKQTQNVNELLKNQDIGLNANQKAKASQERVKTNTPVIKKAREDFKASKVEKGQLDLLEKLNNSGKLPVGAEKINLDSAGNLRFPGIATPETQLFQKTINDFLRNIKNTFGARITDFDIKAFMRKLPSLWNDEEGRRLILRQLKILNDIDRIDQKGLIDAFQDHGGARRVELDNALSIAEIRTDNDVQRLLDEFTNIEGVLDNKRPRIKVQGGTIFEDQLDAFLKAGGKRA